MDEATLKKRVYKFDPFAAVPEYIKVNRDLVAVVNSHVPGGLTGKRIGDIACGLGLMTKLACEIASPASSALMDRSDEALELAQQELGPYSGKTGLEFHVADAQEPLPVKPGTVDVGFLGNCIHNFARKAEAIKYAKEALAPGGLLAVVSTFFEGAYVPGTEILWQRWITRARRIIQEKHWPFEGQKERVQAGKDHWLSQQKYCDLMTENGLVIVRTELQTVELKQNALEAIAEFNDFAQGALRPAPEYLQTATAALKLAAGEIFQGLKGVNAVTAIPRYWMMVIAQKPLQPQYAETT
ncbi:methyltransferase domain-containing protein [Candidatus Woesearchaeota archaeon]|nr:methyltransferase domain-containing protein [Candidatus Woesearchaeota archaeon]